ncbi:hypothetical protein RRG08_042896 [Elysia crispata]|uniref:Uncharacterized protein n=1 Tax=Elysia crispata TaxID=231223 RepID=A0AAE1AWB6_9GAST|nr:hypothetical protein RRG08_042896 [Elysia crispata]
MFQPAPGKPYQELHVTVKGQKLQTVDKFTYLGSSLSRTVNIDVEVNNRIAKASYAFKRLRENVWEQRRLSMTTKLKVYHAVVIATLFYARETWTICSRHARKLNHFHRSCLRRLIRIRWQDKIPDTEVLERADMPSVFTSNRKHMPDGLDTSSGCLTADCRNGCCTASWARANQLWEDRRNAPETA